MEFQAGKRGKKSPLEANVDVWLKRNVVNNDPDTNAESQYWVFGKSHSLRHILSQSEVACILSERVAYEMSPIAHFQPSYDS